MVTFSSPYNVSKKTWSLDALNTAGTTAVNQVKYELDTNITNGSLIPPGVNARA
jgi:hypothetical protein